MPFERTQKLNLSMIKQIELQASQYPDVISLAQGIPSFDTPACIKTRAANALKNGAVAKYSLAPGLPELRELIEISLAKEGMFYDWQKEIIVTAGSIEGITASILAITKPGDEVIIPEPTYTSYREVINLAGCQPVLVPLNEGRGWAFELAKYEQAISRRTKAIFYCNPNNPTGTIYTKEQLLGLAELAKKYDLFLISDEVYKDFPLGRAEKIFSLAQVPELRQRVIRLFSFSKAFAMTGWRIGYVHSDAAVIAEILKVHDSLVTCAPVISQYAAMGALEMGERELVKYRQIYKQRRDLVCARLDKLSQYFSYVEPQGAYYVFPRLKKVWQKKFGRGQSLDSYRFALDLLTQAQVAVVPGVAFGPSGEGHFRLNFGRSEKDLNQAFDRLEQYCQNLA